MIMFSVIMDSINNLSDGERWFYGILLLTASSLFVGLVIQKLNNSLAHSRSRQRDKEIMLRNAVVEFKNSFAPEISAIAAPTTSTDQRSGAFVRHKSAVDAIRPVLPKSYQRKIDKAWNDYIYQCDDLNIGASEEEVVNAIWEAIYDNETFDHKGFVSRFNKLHNCLNKLIK